MERTNKKASEEESGSAVGTSQIQDLETNIYGMIAESLNFWLTEFIMEVCKDTGETYPPRTLSSIFSCIQRHLLNCNKGMRSSLWARWIIAILIAVL